MGNAQYEPRQMLFGPNAGFYRQQLEQQLAGEVKGDLEKRKNLNRVKSLTDIAMKQFMTPASSTPWASGLVSSSQAGTTIAPTSTGVTTVGGTSTLAAQPTTYSLGYGGSLVAPATTASVGAGTTALSTGGSAATGASTGATAGSTAASGASATGIGAGVGAGLAIGSSRPGEFLFPIKKFMYNTMQPLVNIDPAQKYAQTNVINPIFGDPNEQEKQDRERKARAIGLRSAFNMSKVSDEWNGVSNE